MVTLLAFNISKYKYLHLSPGSYYLNGISIDSIESHKDLDFLFDYQLKFHYYTTDVAAKVM